MTSSEPNVADPPVELAHPRIQLGRHDRHQDEVVEADREVERRQARDRDRDEDRHFDERPAVADLLDRLLCALQRRRRPRPRPRPAACAASSSSSRPPRSKRPSATRPPSSTSSVATDPGSRPAAPDLRRSRRHAHRRVISVTSSPRQVSLGLYRRLRLRAASRYCHAPGTCKNWCWMDEFHCSFCGKQRREVRKLISGPRVFICDECVDSVQRHPRQGGSGGAPEVPAARARLSKSSTRTSSARSDAKKALSVAVYNHYKRIGLRGKASDVEIQKGNILLHRADRLRARPCSRRRSPRSSTCRSRSRTPPR